MLKLRNLKKPYLEQLQSDHHPPYIQIFHPSPRFIRRTHWICLSGTFQVVVSLTDVFQ